MTFLLLTVLAFASYAVTTVVTKSEIARSAREGFRTAASWTGSRFLVRWYETDKGWKPIVKDEKDRDQDIETIEGMDPIECPMCVGFWVSAALCLSGEVFSPLNIFAVYGFSYFIHRSEKF